MARSVFTQTEARLALVGAYDAFWPTAKIRLYKAGPTPTPQMALADFTTADFDGYADKTVGAKVATLFNEVGDAEVVLPTQIWTPTGSVTPCTVLGWLIMNTGSSVVSLATKFDNPITLQGTFNSLVLIPRIILPQLALTGRGEAEL